MGLFLLGGILGLIVGSCIGVLMMCILFIGSQADDINLGGEQYE